MDTISPSSILDSLYQSNIQSLIVEGGTILLQSFIDAGLWDEARVFIGPIYFTQGVKSPVLNQRPLHERSVGNVRLLLFASNL
jgi:diaminohydroxyphosphoribosylaminopyrimidine deaminase/5-amino-6-(5-phosphoribosylamino)uracil reductase